MTWKPIWELSLYDCLKKLDARLSEFAKLADNSRSELARTDAMPEQARALDRNSFGKDRLTTLTKQELIQIERIFLACCDG